MWLTFCYWIKAPPSVDILDDLRDDQVEFDESHTGNVRAADLVVNGTVTETKLSLYGKVRIEGIAD